MWHTKCCLRKVARALESQKAYDVIYHRPSSFVFFWSLRSSKRFYIFDRFRSAATPPSIGNECEITRPPAALGLYYLQPALRWRRCGGCVNVGRQKGKRSEIHLFRSRRGIWISNWPIFRSYCNTRVARDRVSLALQSAMHYTHKEPPPPLIYLWKSI